MIEELMGVVKLNPSAMRNDHRERIVMSTFTRNERLFDARRQFVNMSLKSGLAIIKEVAMHSTGFLMTDALPHSLPWKDLRFRDGSAFPLGQDRVANPPEGQGERELTNKNNFCRNLRVFEEVPLKSCVAVN
jgi:hypothetical protein